MTENDAKLLDEVPVRKLFSLLCEYGGQKAKQLEPFYPDVSHRVRHGACLTQDAIFSDRLAACATAGSIMETDAVSSAVAAHPDFHHRGLSGAVVWASLLRLLSRIAYVLCGNEQAGLSYWSLALSPASRWAELDFW